MNNFIQILCVLSHIKCSFSLFYLELSFSSLRTTSSHNHNTCARTVLPYWCTSLIRNRITLPTLRHKSHRKLFVIRHLTKLQALSLCNRNFISTLKFNKSLPLSLTFHFLGVEKAGFHHFIGSLCVWHSIVPHSLDRFKCFQAFHEVLITGTNIIAPLDKSTECRFLSEDSILSLPLHD